MTAACGWDTGSQGSDCAKLVRVWGAEIEWRETRIAGRSAIEQHMAGTGEYE